MTELVYFLGRFHVLLLHLPIGILTLAVVLEIMVRLKPFRGLAVALAPVWIAGAVSAIITVALGYMHALEEGFQGSEAVEAHRWAGVALMVAACVIAVLRLRLSPIATWPKWAASFAPVYDQLRKPFAHGGMLDRFYARMGWIAACVVTFFMMSMTGHLGGNLTHGETYLVEYAPRPLRQLAGLSAEAGPRAKPTDLASADIYLDVVGPALNQRCSSCHNPGKSSGGLNLATHDALMKGGKNAKAVVPGDLTASDLWRRITLPNDHDDFMPADGKTPLSEQQVAAIGWWISQGAPATAKIAALKVTPEVQPALATLLGLPGGSLQLASAPLSPGGPPPAPVAADGSPPEVPAGDPAAIRALESAGFVVRPIARGSNLLDVNRFASTPATDADVSNLAKLGPQLRTLILRRAGVTDARLAALGALPNLVLLRLEENPITDAGAATIARMQSLQSLNLYATEVGDAGLGTLAELPHLSRLHVWETRVTETGAARLRAARPTVSVTMAAPAAAPAAPTA